MFRSTIRDVLWLMVVVGLGVGWWQDRRALHDVQVWWVEHVTEHHAANSNDFKKFLEREWPPQVN